MEFDQLLFSKKYIFSRDGAQSGFIYFLYEVCFTGRLLCYP